MAVIAKDAGDLLFEFGCAQWALMSDASKAPWTVVENTCGIQTSVGSPYAASSFLFTLNGVVAADSPLNISIVDGVYTIGLNPPKTYKGTVTANSVAIPTSEFTLPSDAGFCTVIVRRQVYQPSTDTETRDFELNLPANSVDFEAGLNLNGQIAYIKAWV